MLSQALFLTVCLNICLSNAALLFWSNQKLEITPLTPFDDGDLDSLVQKMGNPQLFKFKVQLKDGNQISKLENIKEILKGYNSAYNPNGNIGTADAIELEVSEECHGIDTAKITQVMSGVNDDTNFLAVIDIASNRQKRDVSPNEENALNKVENPSVKANSNFTSVFYSANNTNLNKLALMYSPRSLELNITKGDKSEIYLLNNTSSDNMIYSDTRFMIMIPIGNGTDQTKIWLRFNFTFVQGYWYIPVVKLEYIPPVAGDEVKENLTAVTKIFARNGFSYHCGTSPAVFKSDQSNTTLKIYGIQVQVNTNQQKFSDAYNCVGFTTIPIWSGLFITAILGVMMVVAITAMMDIKTMDRFDNYKTKNLAINVIE